MYPFRQFLLVASRDISIKRLLLYFLAANLRRTRLRNELNEVEGHQDSTNSENVALKRDKLLLTDEVANLNAKVWCINFVGTSAPSQKHTKRFRICINQAEDYTSTHDGLRRKTSRGSVIFTFVSSLLPSPVGLSLLPGGSFFHFGSHLHIRMC